MVMELLTFMMRMMTTMVSPIQAMIVRMSLEFQCSFNKAVPMGMGTVIHHSTTSFRSMAHSTKMLILMDLGTMRPEPTEMIAQPNLGGQFSEACLDVGMEITTVGLTNLMYFQVIHLSGWTRTVMDMATI